MDPNHWYRFHQNAMAHPNEVMPDWSQERDLPGQLEIETGRRGKLNRNQNPLHHRSPPNLQPLRSASNEPLKNLSSFPDVENTTTLSDCNQTPTTVEVAASVSFETLDITNCVRFGMRFILPNLSEFFSHQNEPTVLHPVSSLVC